MEIYVDIIQDAFISKYWIFLRRSWWWPAREREGEGEGEGEEEGEGEGERESIHTDTDTDTEAEIEIETERDTRIYIYIRTYMPLCMEMYGVTTVFQTRNTNESESLVFA